MINEINITDSSSFFAAGITETLRTVPDPELNVNIIDLGLVYGVDVKEETKSIHVLMTLSSRHCPMGEAILDSVRSCLTYNYPDYAAEVQLTWEPVWSYDSISEEGLRLLRG